MSSSSNFSVHNGGTPRYKFEQNSDPFQAQCAGLTPVWTPCTARGLAGDTKYVRAVLKSAAGLCSALEEAASAIPTVREPGTESVEVVRVSPASTLTENAQTNGPEAASNVRAAHAAVMSAVVDAGKQLRDSRGQIFQGVCLFDLFSEYIC